MLMILVMLLDLAFLLCTALFGPVGAQSSTSAASSSSSSTASVTSSAAAATQTVSVGADGLNYTPNQIFANVGDIIEFRFYPLNHSVARAAYQAPCMPIEDTTPGGVGFWSGFRPVSIVTNDPPIFNLLINDTEPIFFYCSAPDACFDGMIGVINPNSTQTFKTQFAWSQNATDEFSPAEYFPVEASSITRSTTATGFSIAFATTAPSTSPSQTQPLISTPTLTPTLTATHSQSTLSGGAIAGIAIGGFAVLVLAASLIYLCGRQKTLKEMLHNSHRAPNHNSYLPAAGGISEAKYPNMGKSPNLSEVGAGGFIPSGSTYCNPPRTETESYSSRSPPVDEATGMMGQFRDGNMGLGTVSPPLGSAGFPSPLYTGTSFTGSDGREHENAHELDMQRQSLRSQENLNESGPHELAAPISLPFSPQEARPFSYTDSESGYARRRAEDEKILGRLVV